MPFLCLHRRLESTKQTANETWFFSPTGVRGFRVHGVVFGDINPPVFFSLFIWLFFLPTPLFFFFSFFFLLLFPSSVCFQKKEKSFCLQLQRCWFLVPFWVFFSTLILFEFDIVFSLTFSVALVLIVSWVMTVQWAQVLPGTVRWSQVLPRTMRWSHVLPRSAGWSHPVNMSDQIRKRFS